MRIINEHARSCLLRIRRVLGRRRGGIVSGRIPSLPGGGTVRGGIGPCWSAPVNFAYPLGLSKGIRRWVRDRYLSRQARRLGGCLSEGVSKVKQRKPGPVLGVWRNGGLGDCLVGLAFCRALRRAEPKATLLYFMGFDGSEAMAGQLLDLMSGCPDGPDEICYGGPASPDDLRRLVPPLDAVYLPRFVAWGLAKKEFRFRGERLQERFDRLLSKYAALIDTGGTGDFLADRDGRSQWQQLTATAGFEVKESDLWCATEPVDVPHESYIVLCNGSPANRLKCPDASFWSELVRRSRRGGDTPIQIGAPADFAIDGAKDLRGRFSLSQVAFLLKHARHVVSIEGGLTYVARAVGAKLTVLFGPTPVGLYGFQCAENRTSGRCYPCWRYQAGWARRTCPRGFDSCQNFPSPKTVWETLMEQINEDRPRLMESQRWRVGAGSVLAVAIPGQTGA